MHLRRRDHGRLPGVVFLQGATTGGTDLIARLLKLKLAWLPMGRLLLAVDLLVIVAVAVAFRNIYSALYGVVALYISSFVMDQVLYGMDNARWPISSATPTTRFPTPLFTIWTGASPFSTARAAGPGRTRRCCWWPSSRSRSWPSSRPSRASTNAFLIVCEAHEILGDGFREYKHNDL